MKDGFAVVYRMTQAEIDSGQADNIAGSRIEVINSDGVPTGVIYESGAAGQSPIPSGSGGGTTTTESKISDWKPNVSVLANQVAICTVNISTFKTGDIIRCTTAHTTSAIFDAAEAANWQVVSLAINSTTDLISKSIKLETVKYDTTINVNDGTNDRAKIDATSSNISSPDVSKQLRVKNTGIELSKDSGATWKTIGDSVVEDGTLVKIKKADGTTMINIDTVAGSIFPETANTGSIGTAAKPFKDLYVSANTMYIGGKTLSTTGGQLQFDGAPVNTATTGSSMLDWSTGASNWVGEMRRCTTAVGSFKVGDLIRCITAHTATATFDATEASKWEVLSTSGGSGATTIPNWSASKAVIANEIVRATADTTTAKIGDVVRSLSARTTGATFNATEAGNWEIVSQALTVNADIVAKSINVGTATPVASAVFNMQSTTKGFLPPRMTSAQKTAISSPATGLMIFQTDVVPGIYMYNGTAWKKMAFDAAQSFGYSYVTAVSNSTTNYNSTTYATGTQLNFASASGSLISMTVLSSKQLRNDVTAATATMTFAFTAVCSNVTGALFSPAIYVGVNGAQVHTQSYSNLSANSTVNNLSTTATFTLPVNGIIDVRLSCAGGWDIASSISNVSIAG